MLKKFSCIVLVLGFPLSAFAQDFYVSVFGGGGYSSYNGITQTGTAFPSVGGALTVQATGNANNKAGWFGGVNTGYRFGEWVFCVRGSSFCTSPAAEFEGYYMNSRISGDLNNPTSRFHKHLFHDSFKMDIGVLLANSVWTFRIPCSSVEPYVGVGAGTAIVSLNSADSSQIVPPGPGINHFNSGTSASCWTFAAQAKTGVLFQVSRNVKLFAEYRYLYLSSTGYNFGSTQYATLVPISKWAVHFNNMGYNLGSVGIEYNLDSLC